MRNFLCIIALKINIIIIIYLTFSLRSPAEIVLGSFEIHSMRLSDRHFSHPNAQSKQKQRRNLDTETNVASPRVVPEGIKTHVLTWIQSSFTKL